MANESSDARLARLEKALELQMQLIDRLTTAVTGHQGAIEAIAKGLGIKLEQQPAPRAPQTLN